ncbi:zinc-binding alcohol dehydrogenase family protein [Mucilaginibacter achroorhodeus]|uniref:Zinc-binding alcohol dehydrogenase family protein n=1 Tax=Mucilaginibacter achroorhodeus TaxID=2599294 RepID=A0A563U5W2_9SPHI|nr:zinc-binding alcohol dehydrogenase family protein [Mucilaginibacter achroorhodeus]TWR26740.1 zinc-binding alcohol dehydrogenase family protein [Mucilaginibacter achroorhodeus]
MKAAVIYEKSDIPQYVDFSPPQPKNDNEILVHVKAVAIKHFDKGVVSGTHYSSAIERQGGKVIGGDGVCILPDKTRVYAVGVSGMLAEQATIEKGRFVEVPDAVDDATAAALPNAVFGAAMALKFKASIRPGDVILINGATGFTGRVAVQIAKHYGAGKIIVTGRDQQSLSDLLELGADEAVSVLLDEAQFKSKIQSFHQETPINIVIDYLWGRTAELILTALKGDGGFTSRTRYVSVGTMSGDVINLSATILRSTDIQITGSGLGSWSREQVKELFSSILPEIFSLAAAGELVVQTVQVPIKEISSLWQLDIAGGKRLVVTV